MYFPTERQVCVRLPRKFQLCSLPFPHHPREFVVPPLGENVEFTLSAMQITGELKCGENNQDGLLQTADRGRHGGRPQHNLLTRLLLDAIELEYRGRQETNSLQESC